MRRTLPSIVLVALVVSLSAGQQVFRSVRDAVFLDVSVLNRGRPVADLVAGDFRITDNGVEQNATILAVDDVPIDVSLLVDTSYSIDHPEMGIGTPLKRAAAGAWMAHAVPVVGGLLAARDRLQVLVFASDVRAVPIVGGRLDVPQPNETALRARTSFFDALATAALQPSRSGTHHAVLALTDALDTSSLIPYEVLIQVLARSDATVHVVAAGTRDFSGTELRLAAREGAFRPRPQGADEDFALVNIYPPFGGYDWLLEDLVDRTGGRLTISFTGDDFIDAVRTTLEHIRARYLLSYSPLGVDRKGWHDIEVSVPAHSRYEIHARRGYWGQ